MDLILLVFKCFRYSFVDITFLYILGAVYKGRYNGQMVAIKKTMFRGSEKDGNVGDNDDEIFMKEALCLLHEFRQEVIVLAQLDHPNIVALLGVSIRPLCMALEFAPLGSLFDILEAEVERLKQEQTDIVQVSPVLHLPGGVLGHVMTLKIAMQVCGRGVEVVNLCGKELYM